MTLPSDIEEIILRNFTDKDVDIVKQHLEDYRTDHREVTDRIIRCIIH